MTLVLCDAVPLAAAADAARYGGKAVQLGDAVRAGVPVPEGVALSALTVAAVEETEDAVLAAVSPLLACGEPLAVRSSAVGEDSDAASFAGAHRTVLGVRGADGVLAAIAEVRASATAAGAHAYRERLHLGDEAAMGVVVQRLVSADVAGVMFTRNPLTGADERVIEASWGLGEAVVAGIVTPDRFVLGRDGSLRGSAAGEKDIALRWRADGAGVVEEAVDDELVEGPCMGRRQLAALHDLALRCDAVYGDVGHDIEFAFCAGGLYLLQRRPITHAG